MNHARPSRPDRDEDNHMTENTPAQAVYADVTAADISVITQSGTLIEGVTAETPCFVIAANPAIPPYPESINDNWGNDFDRGSQYIVRWFGQALPRGYRPVGVITAGGDIRMSGPCPIEDYQHFTVMVAFHVFGTGSAGLGAESPLRALFDEPVEVLRAGLADGSIADMPHYRSAMLVRSNLDELSHEELVTVMLMLPKPVRASLVIRQTPERQQRVVKALLTPKRDAEAAAAQSV